MGELLWLLSLMAVLAWIASAFLTVFVAVEKGYSLWWFPIGLFLGVLALVAAAGLPDRSAERNS